MWVQGRNGLLARALDAGTDAAPAAAHALPVLQSATPEWPGAHQCLESLPELPWLRLPRAHLSAGCLRLPGGCLRCVLRARPRAQYRPRALQGRAHPHPAAATYSTHAWRICDEQSGLSLAEYVGPSATLSLLADGSLRIQVAAQAPPTVEEAAEAPQGGQAAAEAVPGKGDEER